MVEIPISVRNIENGLPKPEIGSVVNYLNLIII